MGNGILKQQSLDCKWRSVAKYTNKNEYSDHWVLDSDLFPNFNDSDMDNISKIMSVKKGSSEPNNWIILCRRK